MDADKSPEQVRQEIAGVRSDLGHTLDAIEDRVSPGRIVERRKERVRGSFGRVRDAVMGAPSSVQYAMSGSGEGAGLGQRLGATNSGLASGAGSAVQAVGRAPEGLRHQAEGNPLAAGLVAVGLGLLAATLLPVTETEQQWADSLAQTTEPVKQHMIAAGQDLKEHLTPVAHHAVEAVSQSASEAVSQVTTDAQGAVHDVTGHASGAAQQVADKAKDAAGEVQQQGQAVTAH